MKYCFPVLKLFSFTGIHPSTAFERKETITFSHRNRRETSAAKRSSPFSFITPVFLISSFMGHQNKPPGLPQSSQLSPQSSRMKLKPSTVESVANRTIKFEEITYSFCDLIPKPFSKEEEVIIISEKCSAGLRTPSWDMDSAIHF